MSNNVGTNLEMHQKLPLRQQEGEVKRIAPRAALQHSKVLRTWYVYEKEPPEASHGANNIEGVPLLFTVGVKSLRSPGLCQHTTRYEEQGCVTSELTTRAACCTAPPYGPTIINLTCQKVIGVPQHI